MAGIDPYLSSSMGSLTPEVWDGLLRMVETRLRTLEDRASVQDGIANDVVRRGLQVIEDALSPSIVDVENAVAEAREMVTQLEEDVRFGDMFSARSASLVSVGAPGGIRSFVVSDPGGFVPTAYLVAFVNGDPSTSVAGLLSSWDALSGALSISVTMVDGAGTHGDWIITPMSSTEDIEGARTVAVAAAAAASGSAGDAAAALAAAQAVTSRYHGARGTAPGVFQVGDLYLDTSTTPNVMRVRTLAGWEPTVTVSIGGTRNQDYVATAGQADFTVDGGFTGGDVFKNGELLRLTVDYTLNVADGTFTLVSGATLGDKISFRGYLANAATDYYTKLESDARLGVLAPKESPIFTGAPAGPTPSTDDATDKFATTAHVWNAINQQIGNLMTGAGNGLVLQKIAGVWVARTVADMLNTGIGYEVGTFNPTLSSTGIEPVVTYTARQGQYVRIGRQVTFRLEIAGSYSNAPTGIARIGSIPFAANGGGFYVPFRPFGITMNGTPLAAINSNGTIGLTYIQTNGGDVDLNISSVSNSNFRIICSGSYIIP